VSGCQLTPMQTPENNISDHVIIPTVVISRTEIILPTLVRTATKTPSPTVILPSPTAAEIPCLETTGTIHEEKFYSEILAESIKANVYLPPCYNSKREVGYPFLIMLHGQNGVQDQWIKLGLTDLADQWITAKKIEPLAIIMPFERLYLQDSYTSRYDQALVDDLVPQLIRQYNFRLERQYRALGGLSRGGNWAVRVGFAYPDAFEKIGGHSFTTFSGDMNRVKEWLQKDTNSLPQFWFDIGEMDPYRKFSEPFVLYLQQNQVPLEYSVNPGGHTADYWTSHIGEYLTWYTQSWQEK